MKVSDVKRIIKESLQEVMNEVQPESPTGMSAVNLSEAPPVSATGYTELAKVADFQDPEPMKLVKMRGPSAAIDYLVGQKNNYQPKQLSAPPWSATDKTFDRGDYVLYWSEVGQGGQSGYVGLVQVGEGLKEETGTGAVAGYSTPYAFSKKSSGSARALAASTGYKKVSNTTKKNTK